MAKLPPNEHDEEKPRNKRRYDNQERRDEVIPERGVPRKGARPQGDEDDWEDDWDVDDDEDLDIELDDDLVEEDDDALEGDLDDDVDR